MLTIEVLFWDIYKRNLSVASCWFSRNLKKLGQCGNAAHQHADEEKPFGEYQQVGERHEQIFSSTASNEKNLCGISASGWVWSCWWHWVTGCSNAAYQHADEIFFLNITKQHIDERHDKLFRHTNFRVGVGPNNIFCWMSMIWCKGSAKKYLTVSLMFWLKRIVEQE